MTQPARYHDQKRRATKLRQEIKAARGKKPDSEVTALEDRLFEIERGIRAYQARSR